MVTREFGRLRDLPPASQRLIRLMQFVNFGRISLGVRTGEPDLTRRWRVRRTVKLATSTEGPRPEVSLADFELCWEQMALLSALKSIGDSDGVTVDVRHGLPFLVEFEQDDQAA